MISQLTPTRQAPLMDLDIHSEKCRAHHFLKEVVQLVQEGRAMDILLA